MVQNPLKSMGAFSERKIKQFMGKTNNWRGKGKMESGESSKVIN